MSSLETLLLTWRPANDSGNKISLPNEQLFFKAKNNIFKLIVMFPSLKSCLKVQKDISKLISFPT